MSAPAPEAPVGLRALKKQRTRENIAQAALALFLARGFDAVPVVEVARAAEVSEATVFNYFCTKEDLVFDRLDGFWTRLVDAVEHRPADHGLIDAVEDFLLDSGSTSLTRARAAARGPQPGRPWRRSIRRPRALFPGAWVRSAVRRRLRWQAVIPIVQAG